MFPFLALLAASFARAANDEPGVGAQPEDLNYSDRVTLCVCKKVLHTRVPQGTLNICGEELCQKCFTSPETFGCTRSEVSFAGGLELCLIENVPFCYLKEPNGLSGLFSYIEDISQCIWSSEAPNVVQT
eukprot:Gregarina_sp_Pseudo_9__4087@NODE_422_length_2869_cov_53_020141_g399_i0_p4_GENE_NODE_422_length_2869_cov_53_020141_g399_i0NODE_422_length_2869_cov_53_020141_g399_i0_p4_ORF_typecomplete_len129_score19_92_NODE_422_length_2869_cov_53_020141_g399_i08011187